MRRMLRTLILAALAYAAWELIKRATAEQGEGPLPAQEGAPAQSPPSPAPSPAPGVEETPKAAQAAVAPAASNGAGPSKAELYERAQQLGIKGRSKMSKAELERAIHEAG